MVTWYTTPVVVRDDDVELLHDAVTAANSKASATITTPTLLVVRSVLIRELLR